MTEANRIPALTEVGYHVAPGATGRGTPMTEADRILALPEVGYTAPYSVELAEDLARDLQRDTYTAPALLPAQLAFLVAVFDVVHYPAPEGSDGARGVLGLIGCGGGKTLALQLAPHVAGARRPLLILPRTLLNQLDRDLAEWGSHYRLARPPTLTYGKLSHPSGQAVLDELRPDLIMLDEAHLLGKGARAKRLWEYVAAHRDCRVLAVTGSLANRSVMDIGPLAALVLRDWCPLPIDPVTLDKWASVLDVGGEPSKWDREAFDPVVQWANADDRLDATRRGKGVQRAAFAARFRSAPGVLVVQGRVDAEVSLSLSRREVPTSEALERLETLWELPDGTELVDTLEVHRHRRTLRLGFYYRWDPLTVIPEYVEARRAWGSTVRAAVEHQGYDSPYFVQQAAMGGYARSDVMRAWRKWSEWRALTPPTTEAVWIDEGIIQVRLDELFSRVPDGIVWVHSKAIFDRLQGIYDVHRAADDPPTGGRPVVSLAHAKGWNGQAFHHALVFEVPSTARDIEQLLARHHRTGQTHDVHFELFAVEKDVEQLRARARFVQDSTGMPQRFLLAGWTGSQGTVN